MAPIGTRTRHVDWMAITDGSAGYAADLRLEGELAAAVLRSPHPHARIVSIDTSQARALPGVQAVLTAADVPETLYLDYRVMDRDRRILAADVVRHVGEPVALVAADDAETAARALDLIDVRYRRLPVADTVAKALSPSAPAIHPHPEERNVAARVRRDLGVAPQGAPASAHSVRASYSSTRQTHATMEPHTVKAHWKADEKCLHVWAPSQNPRLIHRDLAQLFGLDTSAVRLHQLAIGGDFGGRTQISGTEALVCALSLATGRPVALHQSRAEEFAFTKWRLAWDMDLALGCDAGGKVTTLQASFDVDNGAYNQAGPGEMVYGSVALGSSYRWLGYQADGRCVYTNRVPASSFRGAGGYAINWALECAIDELAEKAGIDPIDFRLANAVGDEHEVSLTGWEIKSSGLRRCLQAVREGIDWDARRRQGGKGRGVGVACTIHVTALSRDYMLRSSCALDIDGRGHVTIRSGCGDAGTGQKTLICQTVSTILGVPLDRISIVTTDTLVTPHDAGAGASRGSFVAVNAARTLASKVRADLSAVALDHFGIGDGEPDWADGVVRNGNHVMELGELALLAGSAQGYSAQTEYVGASHDPDPRGYEDISPTYSFAAHAVEVEVDEALGTVKVLKVVAAHDSGTILNPLSARGQVEGGVVMGLGAVLGESLIFEEGRVVNPSYADYVLPRPADAPPIETIFVDVADSVGPFGSKGLGEIPLITIGPAVTNAIAHATGLRLRTAPHTPDQIVTAARRRDGKSLRAGSIAARPDRWWTAAVRTAYPRGLHKGLRLLSERVGRPRPAGRIETIRPAAGLDEALDLLHEGGADAPIAGGTDLLALETQGLPLPGRLVDIAGLGELRIIETRDDGSLRIGSAVTLAELAESAACDPVLRETAALIATPQIRQAATVGGNLCQTKRCWFFRNGFDCYKRGGATRPCYAVMGDHRFYHSIQDAHRCQAITPSDLATTLVALDAEIEVRSSAGVRRVAAEHFYEGPGETGLAPGEIVCAVEIPAQVRRRQSTYRKLALWQGAFSIATACVSAELSDGRISDLRVALGGVGPVPVRVHRLERMLHGQHPDPAAIEAGIAAWMKGTHPLRDNHWKAFATADLLRRTLSDVLERPS